MPRILVVDDSPIARQAARFMLEERGHDVVELDTPFGFSTALNRVRPDLVLLDVRLPGINGDQLVAIALKHEIHRCPIVFYSSTPADKLERLVEESGADGFLVKGEDPVYAIRYIEKILRM